jgi:hypothetical protein
VEGIGRRLLGGAFPFESRAEFNCFHFFLPESPPSGSDLSDCMEVPFKPGRFGVDSGKKFSAIA